MDLLKSDASFNWTYINSLHQQFIPTKKTKMFNMNVILEKYINFVQRLEKMNVSESVANEHSEGRQS